MEYQALVQLISGVGFPIFMCLTLMTDSKKKMEELTKVIDKNTLTIEKLYAIIEVQQKNTNEMFLKANE
ncbi:hypothetical protein QJK61_18745 [Clostridioides difficile]|nr:hypothetical protein [Clostridioides difficile]MDI6385209.1 hypothetical protein [Clostridioides difficile]HBG2429425.1 hypothetical protein [Clostridioides difficile]